MRKFLTGLLATVIVLVGCAGMEVQKQTTEVPYYETVYWGGVQTCKIDGNIYIGQAYKTQQVFPEKDLQWVIEENSNGDDVEITMIWDVPEGIAVGTCFYNTSAKQENCGVLMFKSVEDKLTFVNTFEGDGENVTELIHNALLIPGFKRSLEEQIEETKDYVVGEPYDLCEHIKKTMDAGE